MACVTRFAPSPTGYLHLGHAYSAILNFEQARGSGGRFHLRIEDIDRKRCRPEYVTAAVEDLTWLGVHWDGPPQRQSERFALYEDCLADLYARGLVYRCFRTQQDLKEAMGAPHGAPLRVFRSAPLAALEERDNLAEGLHYAWRLSLAAAETALRTTFSTLTFLEASDDGVAAQPAEPWRFGDVVLGRKDSGTSYHLASVLDDAAQGVTHVTRGEDLREAAGLHVLLHALFGTTPPVYRHHKLITDEAGRRLSKRYGSESLRSLRERGISASKVRARLFLSSDAQST